MTSIENSLLVVVSELVYLSNEASCKDLQRAFDKIDIKKYSKEFQVCFNKMRALSLRRFSKEELKEQAKNLQRGNLQDKTVGLCILATIANFESFNCK